MMRLEFGFERDIMHEYFRNWLAGKDDNIPMLLDGTHPQLERIFPRQRIIALRNLVDVARIQNAYQNKVFDSITKLFSQEEDEGIRNYVCEYWMKSTIHHTWTVNNSDTLVSHVTTIISTILDLPIANEHTTDKVKIRYIAWYLHAERHSYYPILYQSLTSDVNALDTSFSLLLTSPPDAIQTKARELRDKLRSLRDKLPKDRRLKSAQQKSLWGLLSSKLPHYQYINREVSVSLLSDIPNNVLVSDESWNKIDGGLYSFLQKTDHLGLEGQLTIQLNEFLDQWELSAVLKIECDDQLDSLANCIRDYFAVIHVNDGEMTAIIQGKKESELKPSYPDLFDVITNYRGITEQRYFFKKIYEVARQQLDLSEPDIKDRLVNHTIKQVDTLIGRSNTLLRAFLETPHALTHLAEKQTSGRQQILDRIQIISGRFKKLRNYHQEMMFSEHNRVMIQLVNFFNARFKIIATEFGSWTKKLQFTIRETSDKGVSIKTRETDMVIIMDNLFHNALKSLKLRIDRAGSDFVPKLEIEIEQKIDAVFIRIIDNGVGLAPGLSFNDLLTRSSTEGSGTGLKLIHHILTDDYGGSVSIESNSSSGATFILQFPRK